MSIGSHATAIRIQRVPQHSRVTGRVPFRVGRTGEDLEGGVDQGGEGDGGEADASQADGAQFPFTIVSFEGDDHEVFGPADHSECGDQDQDCPEDAFDGVRHGRLGVGFTRWAGRPLGAKRARSSHGGRKIGNARRCYFATNGA